VGPDRAALFADKTGLRAWDFLAWEAPEQELRFVYDEHKERRNELRRQVHRIPRDMERCLGRAENDGAGPTMRELVALAYTVQPAARMAASPAE
jgi:hypothetical protein